MKHPLRRRWMWAFAAFTLGVAALFGLFAMAFVYTVEDRFLERHLQAEAQRQQAHRAMHGDWAVPADAAITLHMSATTLPADLARVIAAEPQRREVAGHEGRHYHLLPLVGAGAPPWLVAEVSGLLIVRPLREQLLRWLAGWGVVAIAAALALAALLARRTSAPLERLAARVAAARPDAPPERPADPFGASSSGPAAEPPRQAQHDDDEVGALARAFASLTARTREFVAREQAFTRDASHELRTPLAVLRIGIERLLRELPAGAAGDTRRQLITLHATTLAMQQTVETLLALARESSLGPGSAGGAGGAGSAGSAWVPLLPRAEQWVLLHADWLDQQGAVLELRLAPTAALPLPPAVIDLVLGNLLVNAFTHGKPGEPVVAEFSGGALVIHNAGTGDAAPGAGFGLDIVRRLLARHGIELQWEQAQGRTRATVRRTGGPVTATTTPPTALHPPA